MSNTKPNSSQITYDTGVNKQDLNSILDTVVPIADYAALRNYTGRATQIRITADGIAGFFKYDSTDTTSTDNGGTIIVAGTKRWKRIFDGAVNVMWFLPPTDGTTSATVTLQAAINSTPDGNDLDLQGMTFRVQKGVTHTAYPDNDQPCLVVYQKNRITIKNGTLLVLEHGMSALEVISCNHVKIDSVDIVGAGNFPPLDGTTGRGEKGYLSAGYYNEALYNSSGKRNNSFDTSGLTTGGYGGNFPQWGGGTASTWGMWNGGYIGNSGDGIYLVNSSGCSIHHCSISAFNGAGIRVSNSFNTVIAENKIFGNYSSGIALDSIRGGDRAYVSGNYILNNGHPSSLTTDTAIDPGYGFSMGNGSSPIKNITVIGNYFFGNKRKGVDAHSSDGFSVIGNIIEGSAYGVYAQLAQSYSKIGDVNVTGNTIRNIENSPGNIAFGIIIGGNSTTLCSSAVVCGNILEDVGVPIAETPRSSGYAINVFCTDAVTITGNSIVNTGSYLTVGIAAPQTGLLPNNKITVTGNTITGAVNIGATVGGGPSSVSGIVSGNTIELTDVSPYGLTQMGLAGYNQIAASGNSIKCGTAGAVISTIPINAEITFDISFPALTISKIRQKGICILSPLITATSITQGLSIVLGDNIPTLMGASIMQIGINLTRTSDSAIVSNLHERSLSAKDLLIGMAVNDFVAKTATFVAAANCGGSASITLRF